MDTATETKTEDTTSAFPEYEIVMFQMVWYWSILWKNTSNLSQQDYLRAVQA
jgi:hypothetical protein